MPKSERLPKLVLLPGMDGTGELFAQFLEALPREIETVTARYPVDACLSYFELAEIVRPLLPESDPFVILAESFSTPLAIQCAAARPANLVGLILCAGFATTPMREPMRLVLQMIAPLVFRARLSKPVAERVLIGHGAPERLFVQVREAITCVQPKVLADRLRMVLRCDARAELAKVDAPILYLQAVRDRPVPSRCAEEIARLKPTVTIMRVEGPHLVLQREPRRTADAVVNFVQALC